MFGAGVLDVIAGTGNPDYNDNGQPWRLVHGSGGIGRLDLPLGRGELEPAAGVAAFIRAGFAGRLAIVSRPSGPRPSAHSRARW